METPPLSCEALRNSISITEEVGRRMKEWRVLEQERMGDHHDIVWVLGVTRESMRGDDKRKGWEWRV